MVIPVVLDCDPGHDDALAIMLTAAHPALDLLAITTVAGNQTVDKTTLNALRICDIADISGVPVAAGCDMPISGRLRVASDIHGVSGLDGFPFAAPRRSPAKEDAVRFLRRLLLEYPKPVTVIATGPLTNLATLLETFPEIVSKIREIVFMGGSTERGNVTPYGEFNVVADPEATDIVVKSGIPVTMCGLNVTHQALVTSSVINRLRGLGTELADICIELLTFFTHSYQEVFGSRARLFTIRLR